MSKKTLNQNIELKNSLSKNSINQKAELNNSSNIFRSQNIDNLHKKLSEDSKTLFSSIDELSFNELKDLYYTRSADFNVQFSNENKINKIISKISKLNSSKLNSSKLNDINIISRIIGILLKDILVFDIDRLFRDLDSKLAKINKKYQKGGGGRIELIVKGCMSYTITLINQLESIVQAYSIDTVVNVVNVSSNLLSRFVRPVPALNYVSKSYLYLKIGAQTIKGAAIIINKYLLSKPNRNNHHGNIEEGFLAPLANSNGLNTWAHTIGLLGVQRLVQQPNVSVQLRRNLSLLRPNEKVPLRGNLSLPRPHERVPFTPPNQNAPLRGNLSLPRPNQNAPLRRQASYPA